MKREAREEREDSPLIETVARNLRLIREKEGLSQEAFADTVGYHRTYWSALERGTKNLTLRAVERLADKVGVTALDLLKDGDAVDGGAGARYLDKPRWDSTEIG